MGMQIIIGAAVIYIINLVSMGFTATQVMKQVDNYETQNKLDRSRKDKVTLSLTGGLIVSFVMGFPIAMGAGLILSDNLIGGCLFIAGSLFFLARFYWKAAEHKRNLRMWIREQKD